MPRTNGNELAPRVLVVDDGAGDRSIVESILSAAGCEVDAVVNGRDAIEAVLSRRYDLVLMDLGMPVVDGYEACSMIRSLDDARGGMPIIAMSTTAVDELGAEFWSARFDGFLAKPLARGELLLTVNRWLGSRCPALIAEALRPRPGSASIDADVLRRIEEDVGRERVHGILEAFLHEIRSQLVAIPAAVERGALEEVEWQAHGLKSSAGTLGAHRLEINARALEDAAHRRAAGQVEDLALALGSVGEETLATLDCLKRELFSG